MFRTRGEAGEAIWVITRLDRAQHAAVYHRVEPGRYVARVSVRCRALSNARTEVLTSYSFVGLSGDGNREIVSMTQESYDWKMAQWSEWIARSLASGERRPGA